MVFQKIVGLNYSKTKKNKRLVEDSSNNKSGLLKHYRDKQSLNLDKTCLVQPCTMNKSCAV